MLNRLPSWGLALILGLSCSSCAWSEQWFKKKTKADNAQLKKVGAQEEELKKFAVQEAVPALVTAVPTQVAPTVKPADKKPAPATKPKLAEPPKKVEVPVVAVSAPAGFSYPADYPAELKALDAKAAPSWALFKPRLLLNEEMFLNVDYLGMTVGKVVLSYRGVKSMTGRPVHHFQAYFKSAPFYSAIYELDDHLDTYVDQEKFVGLRYNLVQRESKQDVDEVQLYDREKLYTNAYQKLVREGKAKHKKWKGSIPRYSIDPLSVLWLIRGMPLKNGDKYLFPIVNKGKIIEMEATVEAREKIKTKLGEANCVRVKAHTQYTGRTLKSGDMTFWLSDDDKRTLLRAQAKIKIGSVYAEAATGE